MLKREKDQLLLYLFQQERVVVPKDCLDMDLDRGSVHAISSDQELISLIAVSWSLLLMWTCLFLHVH